MIPRIDLATVRFESPQFLWLLLAPALLLASALDLAVRPAMPSSVGDTP